MTSSKIYNFNDFLKGNLNSLLIIPPYQRLYAWKDEQIKALLDDFKNCIEHNEKSENNNNIKTHFIGNLVVAKNEDDFELVDGQQRLSTIFFLCVYMCRKNNKMQKAEGEFANAYKFAFVQKGKEEKCRIHMPIREDDENAIWNYDFEKTNANIKLAFNYFDEYFEDNELESFCNFIFTNVRFNLVILGDQVELNKYFVRMNNTGVQLDGTDILKARLLKLISDYEKEQKIQNEKSEVTKYARIFDECSQMNYFSDFGFVNNNTDPNTTPPTIENIIKNKEKLQNYSNNDKDRAEFESIIDFPTFILHVFKILSRQENRYDFFKNKDIKIDKSKFLENTWDKLNDGLNAEQAKTIIEALKNYRIFFDTFVIKKKLIKDEDKAYYGFYNHSGDKLDSDKTSLYDLATIQNYLRVARRGDNANYHHFLTHYLEFCKGKDLNHQNAKDLKDYLKSIDDFLALKQFNMANDLNNTANLIDGINAINFGDTISIEDNLRDINEDKFSFLNYKNRGNYKINLTYWFHRLEYYLLVGNYFEKEEFEEDFKEKFKIYKNSYHFRNINSVEHILAQHEEDQNNNKLDNKSDIDLFGNLALISSSENSSLSNQGYEKKRIDFKKNKIISLKLFDVFENKKYKDGDKSQWLSKQIKDHQDAMLKVLQNSFFNSKENLK